ncbi:MAG TPA: NAD-dependent epimerase/dehydratase family protein [Rhabdaerophilum sp.]|nr:NAD-dependent epimerase/dehydratase family protein [Rhabdaerophilum sp.]
MSILVAGAGGFVGRRFVEKLRAEGRPVIAGVRKPRESFERMGVEQRVFDAGNPETLAPALKGVTHIVNCIMGGPAEMVASTRNLTEVAVKVGVQRFVHFSSIAVFGNAEGEIGDDFPVGQNVDAYGQAKIDCEHLIRKAQQEGLRTVILRPALIYGPGSEQWTARIARLLRWGRLGDLGAAGDGICNLIHVDDVVAAAVAALDRPEAVNRAFNLAMAEAPSWNRYLMDFSRSLGFTPVFRVPGRNLRIETKLVAIPLKIAAIVTAKLGFGQHLVPDMISPSLGRLFDLEARYHSARADIVLGPSSIGYAEGLRQSADWIGQR